MRLLRPFFFILFLAGFSSLSGQERFYDPEIIREIRITFKEKNWRHILDSLFVTLGDQGRLEGVVTIGGHRYEKAGIRYKGYSSYNASEIKNPFNIDLDYRIRNQNHLGYVKIKLSNVIQDPSFVREVLSYEIARKYMPASEAGFARLFVNDTLIGLYTNVEAVDMKFVKRHWGSDANTFFKGEPAKLEYPFGQNANLALTHGDDSTGYMPYYNMESATGWTNLSELIRKLGQGADSVAPLLNLDRALWMHAFNETILNLDSYIGYSQNYYMYRDDNGQFNPIPWDLNMSFGSFRESDGSTNFQGITIPKIKVLDPLALMNFAVSPRPLMTRLFANDTLKKIYLAHMRTVLNENIRNGWYFYRATDLYSLIDADVKADTNKFYSYDDFLNNLTATVGGSGGMKAYPGLQELMEARLAYLDNYKGFSGEPVITDASHDPAVPVKNQPCWITARITGSTSAWLGYRFRSDGLFSKITLNDDGFHHDGVAGDGIFGAVINPDGNTIQYFFCAMNDSAAALLPERAEYEFFTVQPMISPGDIVVNEVKGDDGDKGWIELFNTTGEPLNLYGIRISTNPASSVGFWLPDTTLAGKGYLVVTPGMFGKRGEGSIKPGIPETGGIVQLFNTSGQMLDSVSYDLQVPGKSSGRYPNGYGTFTYMPPSRGSYNLPGTTPAAGFRMFPNPAKDKINLEMRSSPGVFTVRIFNTMGRLLIQKSFNNEKQESILLTIDISSLASGLYIVNLESPDEKSTRKLVVY